jgi:hypothetical protein
VKYEERKNHMAQLLSTCYEETERHGGEVVMFIGVATGKTKDGSFNLVVSSVDDDVVKFDKKDMNAIIVDELLQAFFGKCKEANINPYQIIAEHAKSDNPNILQSVSWKASS